MAACVAEATRWHRRQSIALRRIDEATEYGQHPCASGDLDATGIAAMIDRSLQLPQELDEI
jgi:hypothetical protein